MKPISDTQMDVLFTKAGELQLKADQLRNKNKEVLRTMYGDDWDMQVRVAAEALKKRCQSMIAEIDNALES